jgi:hypothetical protein
VPLVISMHARVRIELGPGEVRVITIIGAAAVGARHLVEVSAVVGLAAGDSVAVAAVSVVAAPLEAGEL